MASVRAILSSARKRMQSGECKVKNGRVSLFVMTTTRFEQALNSPKKFRVAPRTCRPTVNLIVAYRQRPRCRCSNGTSALASPGHTKSNGRSGSNGIAPAGPTANLNAAYGQRPSCLPRDK